MGTASQSIGLGLAGAVGAARGVEDGRSRVLASGDDGFLMGLSDLESLIGTARSAVVVIYNDAAYGAEIHQYGSQGLTEKPMLIPEMYFSGIARAPALSPMARKRRPMTTPSVAVGLLFMPGGGATPHGALDPRPPLEALRSCPR